MISSSSYQQELLIMFLLINSILATMSTKFNQSSKQSTSSKQQSLISPQRKKPKRTFLVQQHRKEIDDYMMGQIRKNKKSIKHIKNQIQHLKCQMDELKKHSVRQEVNHDILINKVKNTKKNKSLNKSDASLTNFSKGRSSQQLQIPVRRQFLANKDNSNTSRKDSRLMKKTIKARNYDYCHQTVRMMDYSTTRTDRTIKKSNSCEKHERNSRVLLKKKIDQLKIRAHGIKKSADEIKGEIERKITGRMEEYQTKFEMNTSPPCEESDSNRQYEELMQLLRTEKSIKQYTKEKVQQMQMNSYKVQKKYVIQQKVQVHPQEQKNNLSIHMEQSPKCKQDHAEKSMLSTNRDFNHPKSIASATYLPEVRDFKSSSSNLPSETILLQSDKVIAQKQPKPGQANQPQKPQNNDSQFDQLLVECAANRGVGICSGGSELSFEGRAHPHLRSLKQLQFQFDQLVRQQLMSSDPAEKQTLGKTIRTLIRRIAELRELAQGQ